jgi:hypothetical protein
MNGERVRVRLSLWIDSWSQATQHRVIEGSITSLLKKFHPFRPPLQGYKEYLLESQGVALG